MLSSLLSGFFVCVCKSSLMPSEGRRLKTPSELYPLPSLVLTGAALRAGVSAERSLSGPDWTGPDQLDLDHPFSVWARLFSVHYQMKKKMAKYSWMNSFSYKSPLHWHKISGLLWVKWEGGADNIEGRFRV